jgi:UDPglucose 6-dehydrogenase
LICVIGAGYVGLATAACFSELGYDVICLDNNEMKIEDLKRGILPIYEENLGKLVSRNYKNGRLLFTTDTRRAVQESDIIFIAVGTPAMKNGDVNLTNVKKCAQDISRYMNGYKIIVNKSTVPVGTQKMLSELIRSNQTNDSRFDVISNPEFLREGSAVYDIMNPDRIVIGGDSRKAINRVKALYTKVNAPIIITNPESAELIKYAANTFLSLKISYINEIANLCEKVGADIRDISRGIGLDKRIGREFLNAGIGFGGSCFPKDTNALLAISKRVNYDFKILKALIDANNRQKMVIINKLLTVYKSLNNITIGILGLSFKAKSDDVRGSIAVEIIRFLLDRGAFVKVYDPVAIDNIRKLGLDIEYCKDAYAVSEQSDAVLLLTDWNEFKSLDYKIFASGMKRAVIFDGKNLLNGKVMSRLGIEYYSIGNGKMPQFESVLAETI